jgi:hypothetical protein
LEFLELLPLLGLQHLRVGLLRLLGLNLQGEACLQSVKLRLVEPRCLCCLALCRQCCVFKLKLQPLDELLGFLALLEKAPNREVSMGCILLSRKRNRNSIRQGTSQGRQAGVCVCG